MKKVILIMLILAVLFTACAQKQTNEMELGPNTVNLEEESEVKIVKVDYKKDNQQEITTQVEPNIEIIEEENKEVDISQEELNELKTKIDALTFDDLEGLS